MSALALCYLLAQGLLPLLVLASPGSASRDFSWDMFSHGLSCSKLDALARPARGTWTSVRLDLDFASWAQLSRVLLPARLETYARHLCAQLRTETRREVELRFIAECRDDRNGPVLPIVDARRNYCAGPR